MKENYMMNAKKFNFISGLPRSGSTLLSTILNQNPRFTASISDPLINFVKAKIAVVNGELGGRTLISNDHLLNMIRSDFDAFYKDDTEVCFNTSRHWCGETALLKQLYPNFKMIITLRSIPWILDSFERLHRKNPLQIKPLYDNVDWPSVYERSHLLMGNISGNSHIIKLPLNLAKQAVFSEEKDHMLFIEYEAIASNPKYVMEQVYDFLEEDWYDHDFNDTEASYEIYDKDVKIEGLHTVRKDVKLIERNSILPSDLFTLYSGDDFWRCESNPMRGCRFISAQAI